MLRVPPEDLLRDRRRLHRIPGVALAGARGAQQRERVEARNLVVVRIRRVHPLHGCRVRFVPRELVARAEQDVHRFDELALLPGRRFRGALGGRPCQPPEHTARGSQVLCRPERMVVAHRLAPVREREGGIGFLRLAEGVGRQIELEVVQRLGPREERRLRGGFRRRRKVDRAELSGGRRLRAHTLNWTTDDRQRDGDAHNKTEPDGLTREFHDTPPEAWPF